MISAVQLQAPASMASLTRALLCAVASFFGCWVGGHAQCANDVRENYGLSLTESLRNRTLSEQRLEEVRALAQLPVPRGVPIGVPVPVRHAHSPGPVQMLYGRREELSRPGMMCLCTVTSHSPREHT